MKQEHVVLFKKSFGVDPFSGPAFRSSRQEGTQLDFNIDVAVEKLDKNDISDLRRDPTVQNLAPAMPMKLIAPRQSEGEGTSNSVAWGIEEVKANTSPYSGQGIKVAVLDTGIDDSHPAFAGVNLIKRNFTRASNNDENGHGTHVAGTIFGRDVNGIRIGIARGIETAIIGKVLGQGGGSTAQIYQAILWASQTGASVISMSLGIDYPGYVKELTNLGYPTDFATSRALEGYRANILLYAQLAELLKVQGSFMPPSILVAAAGNESKRDENPDYEIAVAPPAASDGVLSVGAVGRKNGSLTVADFSNTGPIVSAPGVDIISASAGGGLVSFDGTSMATPHVTGIMALWAEKMKLEGGFNYGSLMAKVIGNSTLASLGPDQQLADIGAGIVQAPQS